MIMYSQIKAIIQMIAAHFAATVSEWCWVFMDGIWTIALALAASILGIVQTVSSVVRVLLALLVTYGIRSGSSAASGKIPSSQMSW
jgi:hypothetical protein